MSDSLTHVSKYGFTWTPGQGGLALGESLQNCTLRENVSARQASTAQAVCAQVPPPQWCSKQSPSCNNCCCQQHLWGLLGFTNIINFWDFWSFLPNAAVLGVTEGNSTPQVTFCIWGHLCSISTFGWSLLQCAGTNLYFCTAETTQMAKNPLKQTRVGWTLAGS